MVRFQAGMAAVALGLALAVSGCGNGPPAANSGTGGASASGSDVGVASTSIGTATEKIVANADQKFVAAATTAKVGDIIQWTMVGALPHNVTFDTQPALTSSNLSEGDTWQVKFTKAGTYPYHCSIHPGMDGTLTITG